MLGEFEVLDEKEWLKEICDGIENNKYITKKIAEAQMEKQSKYNKLNRGVWNTIKDYLVDKVMAWGGIEMIYDNENLNLGGYEDLLNTYLEIGDRCVPVRYHDGGNLGLQIMNTQEKKREFVAQHRYEQMKNFV